jgi:putative ABC transport system permease protein
LKKDHAKSKAMIKNYLLITLRNFLRNKNYTLINVLGLSIGITSCIIIFLLISNELSFDKFNTKYDRIYRIVQQSFSTSGTDYGAAIPYPIPVAFRNDFTDVPLVTGIHYQEDVLMKIGNEKQRVPNVVFADSLFFDVFDYKVLSGNPKVELGEPNKAFITQSLANKIMKGRDHLTIKLDNQMELEVVGILADPPASSHIKFSMIVSMPSLTKEFLNGLSLDQWGMTVAGYTYIALPEGVSAPSINNRLDAFLKKYRPEEVSKRKYLLQPLSDIHFSRIYEENPGPPNADINNLIMIGVLGVFILAIACINFVNLATALAVKKSKEIGIRKTLGAKRGQLTMYFLGETFLIITFSILISLCATEWMLSWINGFLEKSLELNLLSNPAVIIFLVLLVGFSTFLSGFYPAIILSGFNPIAVLKNKISAQGSSGAGVRKVLVVFQFTIAQVLIIGTLIVADQMDYFKNKPLGFNKEAIINVNIPDNKREFIESIKTQLDGVPGIEMVSISLGGPTSYNNFGTNSYLTEKGKDEAFTIGIKPVDRFYKDVYGLELKAGRWMTETDERGMDNSLPNEQKTFVYIVNEAYVKKLGFASPGDIIGKHITTGLNDIDAEVIGVVGDFHVTSLHEEITPAVLVSFPYFYYDAGIKIKPAYIKETVKEIENVFNDIFPEYEFRYEFMDQHLAQLYRQDERTFTLFKIFSGVSIFIGCLGLYGLISFMANQKLKEVGIRKVLGASVESIVMLFGKEFVRLIVVAFIIAAPLTWYLMNEWLNGFAYRTSIEVTDFVIGIASTLLIALATVSYRSIRSAVVNPVEVLRTE